MFEMNDLMKNFFISFLQYLYFFRDVGSEYFYKIQSIHLNCNNPSSFGDFGKRDTKETFKHVSRKLLNNAKEKNRDRNISNSMQNTIWKSKERSFELAYKIDKLKN